MVEGFDCCERQMALWVSRWLIGSHNGGWWGLITVAGGDCCERVNALEVCLGHMEAHNGRGI